MSKMKPGLSKADHQARMRAKTAKRERQRADKEAARIEAEERRKRQPTRREGIELLFAAVALSASTPLRALRRR